ncbi:MAG: hypothetical protein ACD_78C00161G0003 [uncultured bacterium (gcode 4)]|uniref:Uncharacterized protein n=1 Tax=uncultured bacterium (gcode 4) TaxID=1234023 RepID=K1YCQ7_9BACT|nr:MAG: hypothetical protein ACD_78C00161G0003 [uncultured bacterium (gcode 4)]
MFTLFMLFVKFFIRDSVMGENLKKDEEFSSL